MSTTTRAAPAPGTAQDSEVTGQSGSSPDVVAAGRASSSLTNIGWWTGGEVLPACR